MVEDMDCISMYIVTNKVPMQVCRLHQGWCIVCFVGLHIFDERNAVSKGEELDRYRG